MKNALDKIAYAGITKEDSFSKKKKENLPIKKFRILSCMLAVVMLLFTFASCGSKKVLPGTWTLEEETLKTTLEFGEDGKGKATFETKPGLFGTWVPEMDGITSERELKEDGTGKMTAMGFEETLQLPGP